MPDKDLVLRHDMSIVVASAYDARVLKEPEIRFRRWTKLRICTMWRGVSRRKGIFRNRPLIIEMEKQPLMDRKVHGG
jgi:hypothetical protein